MSVQSDDINDIFDGLRDEPPQGIASLSNDSNLGSSLSNFGIDRDNPEENLRYIQLNQNPLAVIQGIGIEVRNLEGSEKNESGLGTSISKTASSEFSPEVIEFQREDVSDTASTSLNAIVEPEPGPSSGKRYGYDPKYEDSVKLAENLQDLDISSFDLALEKGYRDQAKIYYDDAISKGFHPETKHIKPLKEVATEEQTKKFVTERPLEMNDDFWSEKYALQRIFNLIKDFGEYLEHLENKEYKKVLEKLVYKKELNDKEKLIKKNIGTKANRNNLTLQRETIQITRDFLQFLKEFDTFMKSLKQKHKDEQANEMEKESYKNNVKRHDDDFDKNGATGQSST